MLDWFDCMRRARVRLMSLISFAFCWLVHASTLSLENRLFIKFDNFLVQRRSSQLNLNFTFRRAIKKMQNILNTINKSLKSGCAINKKLTVTLDRENSHATTSWVIAFRIINACLFHPNPCRARPNLVKCTRNNKKRPARCSGTCPVGGLFLPFWCCIMNTLTQWHWALRPDWIAMKVRLILRQIVDRSRAVREDARIREEIKWNRHYTPTFALARQPNLANDFI